jgi:hypothetical protein
MNTNENIRENALEDVIELGVASVETLGGGGTAIEFQGHNVLPGLTED